MLICTVFADFVPCGKPNSTQVCQFINEIPQNAKNEQSGEYENEKNQNQIRHNTKNEQSGEYENEGAENQNEEEENQKAQKSSKTNSKMTANKAQVLVNDTMYAVKDHKLEQVYLIDKEELEQKLKKHEKIVLYTPKNEDSIEMMYVKLSITVLPSEYKEWMDLKKQMIGNRLLHWPTNREFFAEIVREGVRTYKELIKTYTNKQINQDTQDNIGENGFSNQEDEIPVY